MVFYVSHEHFITFAKDVAQEAAMRRNEKTDEKSKVLVSNLFKRSQILYDGLLQAVCGIRFVVSDPVRDILKGLHPQYDKSEDGQTPYISFKGSVLHEHAKTVWTTAYLLPPWADPRHRFDIGIPSHLTRDAFISSILSQLQVLSEPSLKMVTSHCLQICHRLAKENDSEFSEDQGSIRTSVMKNIYKFLQEKVLTSNDVKEHLLNTPCILVERGIWKPKLHQNMYNLYTPKKI